MYSIVQRQDVCLFVHSLKSCSPVLQNKNLGGVSVNEKEHIMHWMLKQIFIEDLNR